MRWAEPELMALLWLVPLFFAAAWAAERRRASLERTLGDPESLRARTGAAGPAVRWARNLLILAAVTLGILGLARPQAGYRLVTTTSRGVDLIVALDLSRSMDARDVRPDRLRAAKREAASLIAALEGSAIGIVGFAGDAQTLSPLSTDSQGLASILDTASADDAGAGGSDLGAAIRLAARLLKRPGERPRAILLLTDGENLSGDPRAAIAAARESGARVFALGVGTTEGTTIPVIGEGGRIAGLRRDPEGRIVHSRLDEALLRDLARRGGGRFERADGTGRVALRIADAVRSEGGVEARGQTVRAYDERFGWFAAGAALFLVAERLVPRRRRS